MANIRNIQSSDYFQYVGLINSNITREYFNNFINDILNENHIIMVIELDTKIVGTGTLLIEEKLTYGGCKMGHIENILISETYRGKQLGQLLMDKLISSAKDKGCYRIELVCSNDLIKFYDKLNFSKHQNCMSLMIEENFNT